jgi:hypothetical protein
MRLRADAQPTFDQRTRENKAIETQSPIHYARDRSIMTETIAYRNFTAQKSQSVAYASSSAVTRPLASLTLSASSSS